jgi:hypothetical protein
MFMPNGIDQRSQYLIEETKIIQDIIKRMANNSFLIKGWAITLIVATLLLKGEQLQLYISLIPLLGFWYLDAYFLHQERLYRRLYNWVIANRLDTENFLFDMNIYRFIGQEQSRLRIMLSISLISFYGLIGILILLYAILSHYFPLAPII